MLGALVPVQVCARVMGLLSLLPGFWPPDYDPLASSLLRQVAAMSNVLGNPVTPFFVPDA